MNNLKPVILHCILRDGFNPRQLHKLEITKEVVHAVKGQVYKHTAMYDQYASVRVRVGYTDFYIDDLAIAMLKYLITQFSQSAISEITSINRGVLQRLASNEYKVELEPVPCSIADYMSMYSLKREDVYDTAYFNLTAVVELVQDTHTPEQIAQSLRLPLRKVKRAFYQVTRKVF